MMTDSKNEINSLEELHLERAKLRAKIYTLERDLKEHYSEVADKVRSVSKVFGAVSKVKNMLGLEELKPATNEPKSYLITAVKVALPLVVGGLISTRGKSLILKSLIGYGLGQLTKYFVSKSLKTFRPSSERVETVVIENDE